MRQRRGGRRVRGNRRRLFRLRIIAWGERMNYSCIDPAAKCRARVFHPCVMMGSFISSQSTTTIIGRLCRRVSQAGISYFCCWMSLGLLDTLSVA